MNTNNQPGPKRPFQVMYWRPKKISRTWLWCSMFVSLAGMAAVEHLPKRTTSGDQETLLAAATDAQSSMQFIAEMQTEKGHRVLSALDPQASHLIGPSMSMVTSKIGSLPSKQTSINPNFAAVVVRWLSDAGVKSGDRVAIGASGSWPALNIAVYSAVKTMNLRPTVILSAGSSQYGANSPDMMWVDMERELHSAGLTSIKASAASMGGLHDRAAGMTTVTRQLLLDAIERNSVELIESPTIAESIDQRMQRYDSKSHDKAYAAYINVGGSSASIGGTLGQEFYLPGVSSAKSVNANSLADVPDCVATRMLARNVPVVHVGNAQKVAEDYEFPVAPVVMPNVGEGLVYGKTVYRIPLVASVMVLITFAMSWIVLPGWPIRVWRAIRPISTAQDICPTSIPANLEWMA
ncbi:MAG: poly-gamma-glutamate system protein [Rubripirellula sp.]